MFVKQGKEPTGKIEEIGEVKDAKKVTASIDWEKPKEEKEEKKENND
jgi:hypothetical protein